MSATDKTKLDGVEAAADVTDAANVESAGAIMDGQISAAEGFLRKTADDSYEAVKLSWNASAAPDPSTDDTTLGYAIGSMWIDTKPIIKFIAVLMPLMVLRFGLRPVQQSVQKRIVLQTKGRLASGCLNRKQDQI